MLLKKKICCIEKGEWENKTKKQKIELKRNRKYTHTHETPIQQSMDKTYKALTIINNRYNRSHCCWKHRNRKEGELVEIKI